MEIGSCYKPDPSVPLTLPGTQSWFLNTCQHSTENAAMIFQVGAKGNVTETFKIKDDALWRQGSAVFPSSSISPIVAAEIVRTNIHSVLAKCQSLC